MRITTKEEAQKLTVPKLREELGHRGLSQEGLKAALMQRLLADIEVKNQEAEGAPRANEAEAEASHPQVGAAADEAEAEANEQAEEEEEAVPASKAQDDAEAPSTTDARADEIANPKDQEEEETDVNGEAKAKVSTNGKGESGAEAATKAKGDGEAAANAEAGADGEAAEKAKAELEAAKKARADSEETEENMVEAEVAEEKKAGAEAAEEDGAEAETPEEDKAEAETPEEDKAEAKTPEEKKVEAEAPEGEKKEAEAPEKPQTEEKAEAEGKLTPGDEASGTPESSAVGVVSSSTTPEPMDVGEAPSDPADKATTGVEAAAKKSAGSAGAAAAASLSSSKPAPAPAAASASASKTPKVKAKAAKAAAAKAKANLKEEKDDDDAASVGGDDEPPTKKAKTANGSSTPKAKATKITKASSDPSGREIFIDNLPPDATEAAVRTLAEEKGGPSVRPTAFLDEIMMNWEAPPKKQSPHHNSRRNSPTPPGWEYGSRIRRARQGATQPGLSSTGWPSDLSAPTPTPTPTATPSQTPTTTPTATPSKEVAGIVSAQGARPHTRVLLSPRPVRPVEALQTPLPRPREHSVRPAPGFSSHRSPSVVVGADPPTRGNSVRVNKAETFGIWVLDGRARSLAEQGQWPSAGEGAGGRGRWVGGVEGGARNQKGGGAPRCLGGATPTRRGLGCADSAEKTKRVVLSIEKEVDGMLDDSKGMLWLSKRDLGDERVPSFSLRRLREAYQSGTGNLRSWTTRGPNVSPVSGDGPPALAQQLVEVEHGRLGVLSSADAYLFHFRIQPMRGDDVDVEEENSTRKDNHEEFHLAYIWFGLEADAKARAAVRAQGRRLLDRLPQSTPQAPPPLEVDQGCEPALFLGLFSCMVPPLAAVVHQTRNETPDLRVFELQESPCLQGSGIALAVEGDASLLANHGPLPSRSYVILVRPHRRRVGKRGGGDRGKGQELVGAFDEGYYWHGVGETTAVEALGNLLCQQVERMFPPPSAAQGRRRRKRGAVGRKRCGGGVVVDSDMMRRCVSDVKLGWPIPDGFWACILPEGSPYLESGFVPEDHRRKLLSQDLRPSSRSRPVRIFGVCFESRKAGRSFVWEVTTGCLPSQMRLSPSLSHVVDAGGSKVYVWHGAGSHGDARRLAFRVSRRYAERVDGGAVVEQVDAGSEPIGLLECFLGWNKALVEPPPMPSISPSRFYTPAYTSADISPPITPTTTASRGDSPSIDAVRSGPWGHHGRRRCRSNSSRASSSGSTSTASRLTPPGQRTPPSLVNSPPSLKYFVGGNGGEAGGSPTRHQYHHSSRAALALPCRPEGLFSTPPRRSRQQPILLRGTGLRRGGIDGGSLRPPPAWARAAPVAADMFTDRMNWASSLNVHSRGAEEMTTGGVERVEVEAEGLEKESADQAAKKETVPSTSNLVSDTDAVNRLGHCGDLVAGVGDDVEMGQMKLFTDCESGKETAQGLDYGARSQGSSRGIEEDGDISGDGNERNEGGNRARSDQDQNVSGNYDGDKDCAQRAHGGGGTVTGNDRECADEGNASGDSVKKREEKKEGDGAHASDVPLRPFAMNICRGLDALKSSSETATCASKMSVSKAFESVGSRGRPGHSSDVFRMPLSGEGAASLVRLSSMISMSGMKTGPPSFDSSVQSLPSDDRSTHVDVAVSFDHRVAAPHNELLDSVVVGRNHGGDSEGALCPGPSVKGPATSLDPASAGEAPTLGPNLDGWTMQDPRASAAAESRCSGASTDVGAPVNQSRDCVKTSPYLESKKASPAVAKAKKACDNRDVLGSEPSVGRYEPARMVNGNGYPLGESRPARHCGDDDGGPPKQNREKYSLAVTEGRGAGACRPWAGLNDDGSWRSEVERRAAGAAGAVEAERRRLAKINGDGSWRADSSGGSEVERERSRETQQQQTRRESTSLTRLQKGNVRDKLNMFEGVSNSAPAKEKEKEVGERSSIGALQDRGLVSALNKSQKLTHREPPNLPPLMIDSATDKNDGEGYRLFQPYSTGAIRNGGRPPAAPHDLEQRSRKFVWWKQPPAASPLKSRPSLELIRNGQVRIMSEQLLMSCPDGYEDTATSTAIAPDASGARSNHKPPVSSSPRPLRPGRLRWAAGSANTSPTKRSNFWLSKAGLGGKHQRECPGSAPATPTNNRKGAWWRKGRTGLTPSPAPAWGNTGSTVAWGVNATEAQRQGHGGSRNATVSWVKLRRRVREGREGEGQN